MANGCRFPVAFCLRKMINSLLQLAISSPGPQISSGGSSPGIRPLSLTSTVCETRNAEQEFTVEPSMEKLSIVRFE